MPKIHQYDPDQFTLNEVRTERRSLLVITCNSCGAAKVVSHFDGSLATWERDHECEGKKVKAS
jgi:hypothetical protein